MNKQFNSTNAFITHLQTQSKALKKMRTINSYTRTVQAAGVSFMLVGAVVNGAYCSTAHAQYRFLYGVVLRKRYVWEWKLQKRLKGNASITKNKRAEIWSYRINGNLYVGEGNWLWHNFVIRRASCGEYKCWYLVTTKWTTLLGPSTLSVSNMKQRDAMVRSYFAASYYSGL